MKILVTGASGNAGQAVCRALNQGGFEVRMADMAPAPPENRAIGEYVRCDTRTVDDVRAAVAGVDGVVHLAAWHCAHQPPVSDATIYAVNVDGAFNVFEACRAAGVRAIVYASSMAYGWGTVYSLSKVLGEEMCRAYQEMTGASIVILRYHGFTPAPYLEYGARMLRNGVDRRDIASSTAAAITAALEGRVGLYSTIVHSNHGMPPEVVERFGALGAAWCESQQPGAARLLSKYAISLPNRVEQHDLSSAARVLGWTPAINFLSFLANLKIRDARGEDVSAISTPGELPEV